MAKKLQIMFCKSVSDAIAVSKGVKKIYSTKIKNDTIEPIYLFTEKISDLSQYTNDSGKMLKKHKRDMWSSVVENRKYMLERLTLKDNFNVSESYNDTMFSIHGLKSGTGLCHLLVSVNTDNNFEVEEQLKRFACFLIDCEFLGKGKTTILFSLEDEFPASEDLKQKLKSLSNASQDEIDEVYNEFVEEYPDWNFTE